MASLHRSALALALLCSSAFLLPVCAEKLDLERITPVPDNQPIPTMDFFRPRLLQDPRLNPSGTHLAAIIAASEDHTSLMVYDLKTQKIDALGTRGDSDISSVTWLDDAHLTFTISVKKLGGFIMCGAEAKSVQSAYPILQNIYGSLFAVPPNDRLHPLVHVGRNSTITGRYGEVMSVNAASKTGTLLDLSGDGANLSAKGLDDADEVNLRHIANRYPILETPEGFDLYYLADKEGQLEFGITSTNGVHTLHRLEGTTWQACPEDLDEMSLVGPGDNRGEIVVLGPRREGKPRALEVLEAATGKVVEVLVQDKTYDADAWLYRDPVSHQIAGAIYQRAAPTVVWFSDAYRNLQKMVDGLFPGQVVRIIGNDELGKMVLISTHSDRQPLIYSWVDLEKHTAGLIKNSRPWIDPKRMQPTNVLKYKTRDGRQLDAYLTMPAGATKQNPPPLVVLPPDYSSDRASWGFSEEVQFLASRGYAVMRPNHRGSSGYTGMFPTEDEWAFHKMHEDITDATRTIIATGLVDRNRVAIMGTSTGGFMALSGVAYEPGLYRCAVAISAVSDWGRLIADYKHDKYSDSYFSRMVRKMGDPKTDPAKWDALAPLRHAGEINVPLFTATGEYDSPMVISGLKDLASAVERNHVAVESVSYSNEAEGVRHLRNKVDLYTRVEAFLAKHLAAAGPR